VCEAAEVDNSLDAGIARGGGEVESALSLEGFEARAIFGVNQVDGGDAIKSCGERSRIEKVGLNEFGTEVARAETSRGSDKTTNSGSTKLLEDPQQTTPDVTRRSREKDHW